MTDGLRRWGIIRFLRIEASIDGIADDCFFVMLVRNKIIRKYAMDFSTARIAALTPWDSYPFELSTLMPHNPFTVITVNQVALFARGTKEFTAVR